MKESDFRKLIRNEEDPVRDEIWYKIEDEIYANTDVVKSEGAAVAVYKTFNKTKFWTWATVILLLFVGIALASYFIWAHFQVPAMRYCTIDDYHIEETDRTIKDYSAENDNAISYIDWYDDLAYLNVQQFMLNTNDEIICVYEQAVTVDNKFCHLYVTDNKTDLDVFDPFKNLAEQFDGIDGFSIKWEVGLNVSYAKFEYNRYKYYLKIEGEINQEYLFNLIERLIETK